MSTHNTDPDVSTPAPRFQMPPLRTFIVRRPDGKSDITVIAHIYRYDDGGMACFYDYIIDVNLGPSTCLRRVFYGGITEVEEQYVMDSTGLIVH